MRSSTLTPTVVESARHLGLHEPIRETVCPMPLETREDAGVKLQFWIIDGKSGNFAFPAFSAQAGKTLPTGGRKFADAQESRELVQRRTFVSKHGRDRRRIQVLHNHDVIESATDRAAVEVALCKSWNRWLADIWRQGKGRLRWSCSGTHAEHARCAGPNSLRQDNGACGC